MGNILCSNKDLIIIDWENFDKKQIGYDLFTFWSSQDLVGYYKRFIYLIEAVNDKLLINLWPDIFKNKYIKLEYIYLFIIEDLIFS